MTLADSHAHRLPHGTARQPKRSTTRVSLREIREVAFRALSAHGASHSEAWVAARIVLDAEIQGEDGIGMALQELEGPRWQRREVHVEESDGRGGSVVVEARVGTVLRYGALALDLALAEAGDHGVLLAGVSGGEGCLESLLCEAAATHQTTVAARMRQGQNWGPLRLAGPDGWAGRGDVVQPSSTRPPRDAPRQGLLMVTPCPGPWLDEPDLTWVSPAQRTERRREVAQFGALVPADVWRSLYEASRRYLVP